MIVADQRSKRDGRAIETIGRYNAQKEPSEIVLDEERLNHWLARGAQPTNTVRKLMRAQGVSSSGERAAVPAASAEGGAGESGEGESAGPEADAAPAGSEAEAAPAGSEAEAAPAGSETEGAATQAS